MTETVVSIQIAQFPDQYSLTLLFVLTVAVLILFIEIGFRLGSRRHGKAVKAQASQARAVMGATLGLLAFMLAFTFATAQTHFETRVANLAEEARLAHNAFLHAEFLGQADHKRAQELLREYVAIRLSLEELTESDQWSEVLALVEESESMQRELWKLAIADGKNKLGPEQSSLRNSPFMVSVVGLIDIHNMRLQAELANRISRIVWATLYLTALLGMLVMGYQAGLIGRRSPIATFTLAISFSVVMMLITDLDRPMTSMFDMSSQSLVILSKNMDEMLENE